MNKLLLTVGLTLLLTTAVNAENYVRAWVSARAYGDTQTMNRVLADARNPYSSIQRYPVNRGSYYYRTPLNVYARPPRIPTHQRFNYRTRQNIVQPVPTNLDTPIRYTLEYYNGRFYRVQRQVNIYYPGNR